MVRRELEFGNFKFYCVCGGGGKAGWGERGEKQKKHFLWVCPIREVFLREMLPHWPSIQIGNGRLQKFSHIS